MYVGKRVTGQKGVNKESETSHQEKRVCMDSGRREEGPENYCLGEIKRTDDDNEIGRAHV